MGPWATIFILAKILKKKLALTFVNNFLTFICYPFMITLKGQYVQKLAVFFATWAIGNFFLCKSFKLFVLMTFIKSLIIICILTGLIYEDNVMYGAIGVLGIMTGLIDSGTAQHSAVTLKLS